MKDTSADLARIQPYAGEPDQLGHRTRHSRDRIRGVQLHNFVSASRSGVADGDCQLNTARSVDLDRAGAEILIAERGVGQAVSERERRGRVEVADAVAVLPSGGAR